MNEERPLSQEEKRKAQFAQLVMMFSTSAFQHLGKIANPMTQKTEVDLEAAKATIDMIEMLAEKTKGNLDKEEEGMLQDTLTTLKLNFVEARKGDAAPPAAPEAPSPAPGEPETGPAAAGEEVVGEKGERSESKQPKFHKKYD